MTAASTATMATTKTTALKTTTRDHDIDDKDDRDRSRDLLRLLLLSSPLLPPSLLSLLPSSLLPFRVFSPPSPFALLSPFFCPSSFPSRRSVVPVSLVLPSSVYPLLFPSALFVFSLYFFFTSALAILPPSSLRLPRVRLLLFCSVPLLFFLFASLLIPSSLVPTSSIHLLLFVSSVSAPIASAMSSLLFCDPFFAHLCYFCSSLFTSHDKLASGPPSARR